MQATDEQTTATQAETEVEQVLRWRFRQPHRAGYRAADAATLAARGDVDLHVAVDLVRAGCPPATALRILL